MDVENTYLSSFEANEDAQQAIDDRRRSERTAQKLPGWISGDTNHRNERGRNILVTDLSMHGVGFIDPTMNYQIGAKHWIVVNGNSLRISTRLRIVSCRQNEEGAYIVGAAFF
ncbi:MAG TPA: PilZ domain-containing protein [Tepidisphaeraceae bacterium]|nr:PilZ domain-containing protein [Tepidisphaeraceae bacterium]